MENNDDLCGYYLERDSVDWPEMSYSAHEISEDAEVVNFCREKNSHRGIKRFKRIRVLRAVQVNQDFLDEICDLNELEYLRMEFVRAEDISALVQLPKLRYLKTWGMNKAIDFTVFTQMNSLKKLMLENTKHLSNLEFLDPLQELEVVGFDGSMWTKQKIDSLKPLAKMKSIEAIFLTSVQLKDKNLDYLAELPKLKYLGCARFAPKKSFDSLRQLMPDLHCKWCDKYEI